MELSFLCLQGGQKLYSVRRNGEEIFVGSQGECRRFLEIHFQKVAQERADEQKTPRAQPFQVRTFRQPKLA